MNEGSTIEQKEITQQLPDSDPQIFLSTRGCVVRTINFLSERLGVPPPPDLLSRRQKELEEADRFLLQTDKSLEEKGSPFIERVKALALAGESLYQMDIKKINHLLKDWLSSHPEITVEIFPIISSTDREKMWQLLEAISQNPSQQIALTLPSHMACIRVEDGKIIFLSDQQEEKPVFLSKEDFFILLTLVLREKREGQILIFHQDEELVGKIKRGVDDNFFNFSPADPDYQQAKTLISQIAQPDEFEKRIFGLRIDGLEREIPKGRVYPYPTRAEWDLTSLGRLTEEEAARLAALARKASLIASVFGEGEETEEKIKILLSQKIEKATPVWLLEVSEGILNFCSLLAKVSESNQLLKAVQGTEPQKFIETYRQDGNRLGENCVRMVSDFIKSLPPRPFLGERETERREREISRSLGVDIAASFFLAGLGSADKNRGLVIENRN